MHKPMQLFRGEVFYFTVSPDEQADSYTYLPDGALVVSEGSILDVGRYDEMYRTYPQASITDYSGRLLMPGLIDSHVHFPQTEMIAMYGRRLLDWLTTYTFPTEIDFQSATHSEQVALLFLRELFRNGTTTCMAYAATSPESADSLFAAASSYDMLMLSGKMLMNRNAPPSLLDTTSESEVDSRRLIERWHGRGRNHYVLSPRFALTSTMDQLQMTGRLLADYPTVYMQTHLSENKQEVDAIHQLFPQAADYLDVYEQAGLLTPRSVFGHCVYLSESEWKRMGEVGGVVAHCPTSNLFLGSGLYSLQAAERYGVSTTLATDVAGGTSFSLWKTMGEAYKVQQLNGFPVSPLQWLYFSTLGTAKALGLDHRIGSFRLGNDADFIVVDYAATNEQQIRLDYLSRKGELTLSNKLFGLQLMGDDRIICATYIKGQSVHSR